MRPCATEQRVYVTETCQLEVGCKVSAIARLGSWNHETTEVKCIWRTAVSDSSVWTSGGQFLQRRCACAWTAGDLGIDVREAPG